jgi:hypothetical protein
MIATIGSVRFILLEKHPTGKKIPPKRRDRTAAHEREALTCHRQSRAAATAGQEKLSLFDACHIDNPLPSRDSTSIIT